MFQTDLTSHYQPGCLLIADTHEEAVRLLKHFAAASTTVKHVTSMAELSAALSDQTWEAVICSAALAACDPVSVLQLVRQQQPALPFYVLPDPATAAPRNSAATAFSPAQNIGLRPEIARAIGLQNNRNERQRADLLLRESEHFFRTLVENSSDAIMLLSATGSVLYTWPSIRHVLGYEPAAFAGQSIFDLIHPEELSDCRQRFTAMVSEQQRTITFRCRLRRQDGNWRWLDCHATNLLDEPGFCSIVVNCSDVTERELAVEALRRNEERYRQFFEKNRAIKLLLDPATLAIADANPAAAEFYGYSVSQLREMNLTEILADEIVPSAAEFRHLLTAPAPLRVFRHRLASGEIRDVELLACLIETGWTKQIYCIVNDVTERLQAEAAQLRLQAHLNEVQKIESIGTLAGGIAHDFNNLLTAIIGNTQLALTRLASDHAAHALLKEVHKASDRAAALTRQLLAFSRRQRLERRAMDLNQTIQDFLTMLRRIIGEQIEIRVSLDKQMVPVFADAAQIEQVMMNLCVNARDAMPQGGKLLIETQLVTLEEEFCRQHAWARPGRYGRVSICDTGVGMDAETLRRIFEPFFTTREQGKGTGLGLAVVYGIIKQHEGFIDVESASAHGTTLRMYLPVAGTEDWQKQSESAPACFSTGNETILLAEDEPLLRELGKTVLTELGYQVLLATDGREAVELCRTHQEISLLLLDVVMPHLGGREAYEQIVAAGRNIPAIFVTGYSSEVINPEFLARTKTLLVSKPYDIETLGQRIRERLCPAISSAPNNSARPS